jgi:hypothetical protein
MTRNQPTFSILISTKNRKTNLAFTLGKINSLLGIDTVECVVFDDDFINLFGSTGNVVNIHFFSNH